MDLASDLPLLIVLGLCFGAAVILAGAETSLIRISPVRVETMAEEGRARAHRLLLLLDDLPRVLNTILLTVLLVQIGAATVTGLLAERWFGSVGVTVASIVLTFILFVYTESIPKTYAYRHPDRVALAVVYPVSALVWLLRPVVGALVWFADLHAPGRGTATAPTITERELRRLAEEAAAEGEITAVDRDLIERAFRFGDRTVDEIMVPRVDVVSVGSAVTAGAALDIAMQAGHRRLLVTGDDIDDVIGVVYLRDLLTSDPGGEDRSVGDLARVPLVVSEWTRVADVLHRMQVEGTHLAVLIDEHGGTAGIATIEDIAEELLGAVARPSDAPSGDAVKVGEGRWRVDGSLPVDDVADLIGTDLPDGDWTTVAGMIMGLTGSVPRAGDEVSAAGHRFTVSVVRRNRIRTVTVARLPGEDPG